MTPKEKAENLTWHFYNKIEHMLTDEYSHFDWNIAISIAKDVVSEVILSATNKKTVKYWNKVSIELDYLIINKN